MKSSIIWSEVDGKVICSEVARPTSQDSSAIRTAAKPTQFNWRRHWSRKVAPHLEKEDVQISLDLGMMMLDRTWQRGDPPYLLGAMPFLWSRAVPGKLSWYRPFGRCHFIAFFSMAIGVLNYPHLDWQFVSGPLHTVPAGFAADGQPKVVMDILLFDELTAEESIGHATNKVAGAPEGKGWDKVFSAFVNMTVPSLRASALGHCRPCEDHGGLTNRGLSPRPESHGPEQSATRRRAS